MNKLFPYIPIFPLLLLIAIITSCNAQEKPKDKSKNNPPTTKPLVLSDAPGYLQIAEYIRNIIQDKNGHHWFGTNNLGVAHFDGDSLYYFSHEQGFSGRQITGMTEDPKGNIWFATDRGIVKYELAASKNGEKKFTNYTNPEVFKESFIWSIFSDSQGTIWVGTREGVCRFDGAGLERFELPFTTEKPEGGFFTNVNIWSIMEDKKGNIWFGTNGNGAFKYDPSAERSGSGKAFTQYTEKDGLSDNSVDKILEDKKGNIWFGTRYGGISHYDGKNFVNYSAKNSIGDNEVCSIYEDRAGNVWFSSEGFGVYRYSGESLPSGLASFTNFFSNEGLGVRAVQTIYEDREGRLWVGGGGGLYRLSDETMPTGEARFIHVSKIGPWK